MKMHLDGNVRLDQALALLGYKDEMQSSHYRSNLLHAVMMLAATTHKQRGGYRDNAIRFADADGGVTTTAYSYSMSEEEKFAMARRITAALNLTRHLTVEQMEAAAPLVKR